MNNKLRRSRRMGHLCSREMGHRWNADGEQPRARSPRRRHPSAHHPTPGGSGAQAVSRPPQAPA